MILSPVDSALFFRLYWGLNAYVNRQLAILPNQFTAASFRTIPMEQLATVRDAWVKHPELLAKYLAEDPDRLSPEDHAIVASWRLKVAGQFFVVRHLKKYSVFLEQRQPGHLYGVLGLQTPMSDLLERPLPVLVNAVLLPFDGVMVSDGLIVSTSVHFGSDIRADLNEAYTRIKSREGITVRMDSAGPGVEGKPAQRPAHDWGEQVAEIAARAERMRSAGEPQQSAALNLLRASACLAQAVFHTPGERHARFRALRRAVTQMERLLTEEGYDL